MSGEQNCIVFLGISTICPADVIHIFFFFVWNLQKNLNTKSVDHSSIYIKISQFINNLFGCLFGMPSMIPISSIFFHSIAFYLYFCSLQNLLYRNYLKLNNVSLPDDCTSIEIQVED